jgi:hypothetical protein
MKRGGPIQRRTELKATKPMNRGKGFKQAANPSKRKSSSQAKTNKGLDALNRQARARDLDTCVRCGVVVGTGGNVHHRRNRGMGGSRRANVISNALVLCGSPTEGCHGSVTLRPWEIDAERYGWVLPTNGTADPATVPVMVAWLGWAYPLADGTWQVIDDLEAVAA